MGGNSFRFVKVIFIGILSIVAISFIFRIVMIAGVWGSGGKVYTIDVNTFNSVESYTASGYERDDKSGCIRFKDEFGISHVVCNNYTITEY